MICCITLCYKIGPKEVTASKTVKKAMMAEVKGRRSVGRQRIRWRDVTRSDMNKLHVQDDAMDRNRWKRINRAADTAIQLDYGRMEKKKKKKKWHHQL
ncbi:hypothetical protein E2C01_001693 [Portunus trituberculatus]|uniref:Uncharacterized protein n=1 Tax=Portunus trituberculatus TaxID=210409 RepID=A0A5B7CI93_PORTR|nr:hypothetical protein [Portunus trituberculatus]